MEVHPCQPLISLWFIYTKNVPEARACLLHGLSLHWNASHFSSHLGCGSSSFPFSNFRERVVSGKRHGLRGPFLPSAEGAGWWEAQQGTYCDSSCLLLHFCLYPLLRIFCWASKEAPHSELCPFRLNLFSEVGAHYFYAVSLILECEHFHFTEVSGPRVWLPCPVPSVSIIPDPWGSRTFSSQRLYLTLPISQFQTFSDLTAGFPSSWASRPSKNLWDCLLQPE